MKTTQIAELKRQIRKRDGNRCRDCGIAEKEYRKTRRAGLHVHRLIPGSIYTKRGTVTLCGRCHRRRHSSGKAKPDLRPIQISTKEIERIIHRRFRGYRTGLAAAIGISESYLIRWMMNGGCPVGAKGSDKLAAMVWYWESGRSSPKLEIHKKLTQLRGRAARASA